MIEKDSGRPQTNKLRVIHLLEADLTWPRERFGADASWQGEPGTLETNSSGGSYNGQSEDGAPSISPRTRDDATGPT
jgi:hypothetical protein